MRTTWALFVLSVVLLSFGASTVHFVSESDEPAYLAAARDLSVFDGRPYVLHPPAYPLAVRAVSLVGPRLELAALLLGIAASAGLVALTHRLALEVSGSEAGALAAAIGLASSRVLAFQAHGAFREPLLVLALYGSIVAILRGRPVVAGVLAAVAALSFDLAGVAAPLFFATGLLSGKRRAGVVASLSGTLCWLAWALWRWHLVAASGAYPAGIDGMLEETDRFSLAAFVNPNFLSETAAHNAHYWPFRLTPGNLVLLASPSLLSSDASVLDVSEGAAFWGAGSVWMALAAIGVALGLREGRARTVAAIALPLLLVGGAGLFGKQARYAVPLVPLFFVLVSLGVAQVAASAKAHVLVRALAGVGVALVAATAVERPHFVPSEPWLYGTRSVAEVLSALPAGARVAAYHGLPPELAWLLPGRRVLATPLRAERVTEFLEREPPDVIVLPLAVPAPAGAPRAELDAIGVTGLADLDHRPGFVTLGIAFEAERTDRARVHAYRVAVRPGSPLARFGAHLPPGEAAIVAEALQAGGCDSFIIRALKATRSALADSKDPGIPALLAALEREN